MNEQFSRSAILIGPEGMERLRNARVAVFGVGGVGGYVVEALARGGIGALDLIDNDRVSLSNLNRQIFALHSTLGRLKVDVARERVLDINPEIRVNTRAEFFLPENADTFPFEQWDFVVDAIDTISGKLEIITRCRRMGIPVISAMGAGNKMDPSRFRVADIYDTKVCPLCRVMRTHLRKRGVEHLTVVYSEEEPIQPKDAPVNESSGHPVPGSLSFVPGAMGLILASEVIRQLTDTTETREPHGT